MSAAPVPVERELKFDVPPGATVPADVGCGLVLGPPTVRRLVATYHDTAGGALLAAGITFRHRVGERAGGTWTVKIETGAADRAARCRFEHELDAPAAPMPSVLASALRFPAGGAPLVPVATIATERTTRTVVRDGAVVAELTDDRVEGRRADGALVAWREWELEVTDLRNRELRDVVTNLTAAGAVPSEATSKLARTLAGPDVSPDREVGAFDDGGGLVTVAGALCSIVAEQVGRIDRGAVLVQLSATEDAVHDLRVAVRRLRSHLRTYAPLLQPEPAAALRGALAPIADALGVARDLDVRLPALAGVAVTVDDRIAVEELEARFGAARQGAVVDLNRLLGGVEAVAAAQALHRFAEWMPLAVDGEEPAADYLVACTRAEIRRLVRRARACDADSALEELHRVRIAAKRARYAVEATAIVHADRKLERRLTRLQDVLGELHDAALATEHWRATAVAASPGAAFVAGRIAERSHRAERRLRVRWKHTYRAARPGLRSYGSRI